MPSLRRRSGSDRPVAAGLVLTSMVSVQLGAAIATSIFDEVGPAGAVMLRLALAVPFFFMLWPPRGLPPAWSQRMTAVWLGVALAGMNFSIYMAIDRIPLGVAITIEFLGPLAVAVVMSRHRLAIAWAAIAALGVVALSWDGGGSFDLLGFGLAAIAAACWAAYIVLTARLGRAFATGSGLGIAVAVAALLCLPAGLASGGADLADPQVLGVGLVVALLASVIVYSAELEALRRIPESVFGVLMSLEPAIAAAIGLVVLGQGLVALELLGIACVVCASVGAVRTGPPPVGA